MKSPIFKSLLIGTVLTLFPQVSSASSSITTDSMVRFTGPSINANVGGAVALGDVNGDGYDDMVMGAYIDGDSVPGSAYLIYGTADQASSLTISAANAITFSGTSADDQVGTSLAVGDLNNDGFDDIVIGAPQNGDGQNMAGAVYVVYSSATKLTGNTSLSSVVELYGSGDNGGNGGQAGSVVATGDINGDGSADLLVGTPNANPGGLSSAGWVKVIYGSTTQLTSSSLISQGILITGETANDTFGSSVTTGDINNDGYDDLFMAAPSNADGGAPNTGAVYVVYGSSSALSASAASSAVEITGAIANEMLGIGMAVTDTNNDGIGDLLLGNWAGTGITGTVYFINGQTSHLSSNAANIAASNALSSTTTGDQFGLSIATGDVNGDGFGEMLIGSRGYRFLGHEGAVYLAYLSFDGDHDGVLGTDGLVNTDTDCDDTDATVTENQTYWPDTDTDGLGDPDGTTTSVCASTAPDGYADNSSDTNDTIPNNGVEIDGDSVDNDGDTEIDEHNTIAENGAHPYYSTLSPSTSAVSTITSVVGRNHGKVTVTYADNSVYDYTVFTTTSSKTTKVDQYKHTGYAVVLKKNGTKAVLLDLYTGDKADTQDLSTTATTSASLLLDDVRNDGSTEAIVTTKTKSTVKVFLLHVKKNTGKINLYDKLTLHNKNVETSKTRTHKKKLQLRSDSNKVLFTLDVSKKYILSEQVTA